MGKVFGPFTKVFLFYEIIFSAENHFCTTVHIFVLEEIFCTERNIL